LSVENLAARLDALDTDGAFVSESEAAVSISNLEAEVAREVLGQANALGWAARAFDGAGTEWALENLDEDFAPFRVDVDKPPPAAGVLRLLTNVGFAAWLEREDAGPQWQVARLTRDLVTIGACFTPWDEAAPQVSADVPVRSPRTIVREFSGQRAVPVSLDRWLLRHSEDFKFDDPSVVVWAEWASRMLLLSLPDEYDSDQRILRFKGPPRLELSYSAPGTSVAATLGESGFHALQAAVAWVFEAERESEMRHILLATELARCGGTGDEGPQFLRDNIDAALEGAKTAYQVQLAGMSSDALKTLAELRKSVTDETAKVADATRQIITAVASALAVGAGLIAARLTTTASPLLILLVMVMAGTYVVITILSGVMFTLLQRKVRKEWQPRLYRFLSNSDYDALVGRPARAAETALWWSSALGAIAIAVMALAIFLVRPSPSPSENIRGARSADAATLLNTVETPAPLDSSDAPAIGNAGNESFTLDPRPKAPAAGK